MAKDYITASEHGTVVRELPPRPPGVRVGKPRKLDARVLRSKQAAFGGGIGGGYGGIGVGGVGGNTALGSGGNFYSPELSTDFLELSQSLDELRQYFRFFYDNNAMVGQAIDLITELPMSKVVFGFPQAKNQELARKAKRFCEKWAKRTDFFNVLLSVTHEYHKLGEAFIWCEDTSPDEPDDFFEVVSYIDEQGVAHEDEVLKEDPETRQRHLEWLQKNYKGWTKIRTLPPEQIHMEKIPHTDRVNIELIIDSKTRDYVSRADRGEHPYVEHVKAMPRVIVEAARQGSRVRLNTDPEAGSFVHYMSRNYSMYESRGKSILQRVIRDLVYYDKLRQAQTSIASRNMTPTRVIYSEGMSELDIERLREQVDLSLIDPDFSIITNYQVNWEEMNSNGRLLDLSTEYDIINRHLYSGMGVTESLLSGENSFGGDRINIETINTRFMLLRERIQALVEKHIVSPMCRRMGFVEIDEDGDEVVIVPPLTFTRLGLRDNDSTFDHLFNLYQKGSLDLWTIYDQLNIDGHVVAERLKSDILTLNDPNFNEVMRGMYSRLGDEIVDRSDVTERVIKYLGFNYQADPEDGRF